MRIKRARFSEYIKSSVRSFDEDGHANSKESARTARSIRKWNFPGYQSRIHAVETVWPITNPYPLHVFLSCKSRCSLMDSILILWNLYRNKAISHFPGSESFGNDIIWDLLYIIFNIPRTAKFGKYFQNSIFC